MQRKNMEIKLIANDEIFKPIKEYGNSYYISNYGRVWSSKTNVFMKLGLNRLGYVRVQFWHNSKSYHTIVHRLVAQYFIPNPENLLEVNHKDGNKQNNHVENLEWCTRSQNVKHAFDNGLKVNKKGFEHPKSKVFNQFDLQGNWIRAWRGINACANVLNIDRNLITQNLNGRSKTCFGFIFSYDDTINADEHKHDTSNFKPIVGVSLTDGHEIHYDCVNETEKDGFNPSNIVKCCNGKRSSHKGFKWRYANSDFIEHIKTSPQFKSVIATYPNGTTKTFSTLSSTCKYFGLNKKTVSANLIKHNFYNFNGIKLLYK